MVSVRQRAVRRSQIEILIQILDSASGSDISKTLLAQRSGLNFRRFGKYFALLEKHGLIECLKLDGVITLTYKTSEKGLAAQRMLMEFQELILETPEAGDPVLGAPLVL